MRKTLAITTAMLVVFGLVLRAYYTLILSVLVVDMV